MAKVLVGVVMQGCMAFGRGANYAKLCKMSASI